MGLASDCLIDHDSLYLPDAPPVFQQNGPRFGDLIGGRREGLIDGSNLARVNRRFTGKSHVRGLERRLLKSGQVADIEKRRIDSRDTGCRARAHQRYTTLHEVWRRRSTAWNFCRKNVRSRRTFSSRLKASTRTPWPTLTPGPNTTQGSTRTDADGNSRTFEAGSTFVVAAGFKGTWGNLTDVRKVYVILN